MGPLKRIMDELNRRINEYGDAILDSLDSDDHSGYIMLISEKRGIEQALRIVQAEYDKYYQPRCKQEQLEINFKNTKEQ